MLLIQIILPIFFVLAAIKAIGRYRAGDLTIGTTIVWMVVWIIGIAIVVNPNSTFMLARLLGVARGADAVVYLSLAILFFVVFRMFTTIEKLKKEIVVLTRKDALDQKK